MAGKRGRPRGGAPGQGREPPPPPRAAAGGSRLSGPGRRAGAKEGMSGGRLRSSSGRSPPRARMAALSWASSGSSSSREGLAFREGLAAVGRAGGFFWVSLWGQTQT